MHETSERATDESEDGRAASTSNRCPPASSPRNEKCSAAASVEPSTACTADARPSGKTTEELPEDVPRLVEKRRLPLIAKHFDGHPLLNGALRVARDIEEGRLEKVHDRLAYLYEFADGVLNTGHYADVEDRFRLFYAYVCTLKARLLYEQGDFKGALRACDDGLLKGNDLEDGTLARFASFLCRHRLPAPPSLHMSPEDVSLDPPKALPTSTTIPLLTMPSMEVFFERFFSPQRPVVIRGMVAEWPAFEKWSFDYFNSTCGHRTVPVELGRKYTDEEWRQELMTFHEYLARYVSPPEGEEPTEPGYLAQHRLPDQVPELLDDIVIPDYCAFAEGGLDEDKITLNMFVGPAGTVSPLHTDPRHNFFCQVRGRKFVRLINPSFRQKLYLFEDLMRKNTSQVDVEVPDLGQFPDFATVQCEDFVMEAGDCLFIPKGYFHHVRSLEKSISVSIWFGVP